MPARRTRRILAASTVDQVLLDAQLARRAMVRLATEAPIGGPEYQAAEAVMAALDSLAEALTGNRRLWHAPPHSTP